MVKNWSLKAAWPVRWSERNQAELKWFFNNLPVRDNSIWECNLEDSDVRKYRQGKMLSSSFSILEAWVKYRYKPVIEELEEILFSKLVGNSLIKRNNMEIFDKHLTENDIDLVIHIFNVTTKCFYTLHQLEVENKKINPIYHYGILAAIPRFWKVILRNSIITEELDYVVQVNQLQKHKKVTSYVY